MDDQSIQNPSEPLAAAVAPASAAHTPVDTTPQAAVISMGSAEPVMEGQQETAQAEAPAVAPQAPPKPVAPPSILEDKPMGPKFFGYKPPKWVHDFDYVRRNKGKGSLNDAETWLLYTVDRLLKMHSV